MLYKLVVKYRLSNESSLLFQYANDEIFSNESANIRHGQSWCEKGFSEQDFLNEKEFILNSNSLSNTKKYFSLV